MEPGLSRPTPNTAVARAGNGARMGGVKSLLGSSLALVVFLVVVVGGGLLWYLSHTAEFSRRPGAEPAPPAAVRPLAQPVR